MQTNLADFIKHTRAGEEADAILRKCVHCGFCTATCPTYQLLGDELDGPRGRIYLIKQVLEGQPATVKTQQHLDRCLTCRNCESTCPSGVQYGRLIDIGRQVVEQQVGRPLGQKFIRASLKNLLTRPAVFNPALRAGQLLRPLLPGVLKNKVPQHSGTAAVSLPELPRKMLMLEGCVQPGMAPQINTATRQVLHQLGISLIAPASAGCCGAIRHHLNDEHGGLQDMRNNIDAWWPYIESGVEAIIMNASGCGVTVKDYGHMLAHDPAYADKAKRVSELTRDLSELMVDLIPELQQKAVSPGAERIVWHPPCTLQHGQKIRGKVETVLQAIGVDVKLCADSHLCCGSAGTYSILQSELAYQLRDRKLNNLLAEKPDRIVSANIGCISHLQSGTDKPVQHWIELVAQRLSAA